MSLHDLILCDPSRKIKSLKTLSSYRAACNPIQKDVMLFFYLNTD